MPRVMVSLPADLLAAVDREAARRGARRSELLAGAVRRELDRQDPSGLDTLLEEARAGLRDVAACDSADLVRAERDS